MTPKPVEKTEPKLPRRDWVLLPLLSLLTIFLLFTSVEMASRRIFRESQRTFANCLMLHDATTGVRGIPGCTFHQSDREAGTIDYQLDSRGYRNEKDLQPKQPGVLRIVMTGSSIALGEQVDRQHSLATLLPSELSQQTGRSVELYNEGMGYGFSHNTALRFRDVLSAQPDMVLWILTPYDVQNASQVLPLDLVAWTQQRFTDKIKGRIQSYFGSGSVSVAASELLGRTRTAYALRFFFYRSPSAFVKSYLAGADTEEGFLRAQPSPFWVRNFKQVDADAKDIEARAAKAGVPFVAVYLPNHAQTEMLSSGQWPAGYDPYRIDQQLRTIITSHGGIFLDILPGVHDATDTNEDFLPVDGHPNALGHALFARLIAQQLTSGVIPDLAAGKQGIDASAMRKK